MKGNLAAAARRADKAIAVFDSGMGGLTVLRELRRAMPSERLVYFGDTARLPYGSKSKEAVTRFSLEIARFLLRRDIKMLVVACNSASALALPALEAALDVPVFGVIGPAVRAAAALARGGAAPGAHGAERSRGAARPGIVGVIGTEATVRSGAYPRELSAIGCRRIAVRAAPLFVPLVEEGWWDHPVTRSVAREYLAPLKKRKLRVLILGCTHYPMLKKTLRVAAGSRVLLVDSGVETAREVRMWLRERGLMRKGRGSEEFFVSDAPERFKRMARLFLGRKVPKVRLARVGV
ncbi:MAG: glutamate racemase [Elusimicrobiota bacterium]|jgi:glutamate racemase